MEEVLRTVITKMPLVVAGQVMACPQLSKEQLHGKAEDDFLPFPVVVFPQENNHWEWAWTDRRNARWVIECWLDFAKSNQQHITAAQQACRLACQQAINSTFTPKDKVL
jgi:hypothetical protein